MQCLCVKIADVTLTMPASTPANANILFLRLLIIEIGGFALAARNPPPSWAK